MPPTAPTLLDRLRESIELLESIAADRRVLDGLSEEDRKRLLKAVATVHHPDRVERRRMAKITAREQKAARVEQDEALLHETGIRSLRRKPVFTTPNVFPPEHFEPHDVDEESAPRAAREPQLCYVCKQTYSVIHHFYDELCPPCAELNYAKRTELADLRGRVALLTGGRMKIGYQAGLKLLRSGAQLIVTTRFPRDAAQRYAREPDFGDWADRLEIFGLDLRHTPSVELFARFLAERLPRLDYILNNACQTVRRPAGFFQHLLAREAESIATFPGDLPDDPATLFAPGSTFRGLSTTGLDNADYRFLRFRPPPLERNKDGGLELPHIRLDRALQFLIGDRLA